MALVSPEARKRRKKCAALYEFGKRERGSHLEQFFDLGFAAIVKTKRFSWPVYSFLTSSTKFDIVKAEKTRIWDNLGAI